MPPKFRSKTSKGKSSIKVNSTNCENETPRTIDPESLAQFEVELCWCIQQLQRILNSGKLGQKEVQENTKVLNTLMSNSSSFIKKRQLMRLTFGDYRAKMLEEDKKTAKGINMKISSSSPSEKSKFVKKSSSTVTDNNFKFNFDLKNDEDSFSANTTSAESLMIKNMNSSLIFSNSDNTFRFNFCTNDVSDNC